MLEALCQVLIDSGVVSEQRLSAEIHRRSFAAVRQAHSCGWSRSLCCVFRCSDVALNIASFFLNKRDCVGLRKASRAFATCMAQVSSAMVRPKVFVWGGDQPGRHEAVEMFDPVSNTWETFPSSAEYRVGAASVVINGRMYVCGGLSGDPDSPSASLDCFDPVSTTWQTLPPMSQGRHGHAAAVVGARLYVCGGWSGPSCPRVRRMLRHVDQHVAVTSSHASSTCSEGHAAVIKNHVYIVGGDTNKTCFGALASHRKLAGAASDESTQTWLRDCSCRRQALRLWWAPLEPQWSDSTPMLVSGSCFSQCLKNVLFPRSPSCTASCTCVVVWAARTCLCLRWSASTPRTTHGSGSHP